MDIWGLGSRTQENKEDTKRQLGTGLRGCREL